MYDLKPKVLCQLFDAFVGSILSYGSEIWGYTKSKEIERIHLKFCKRLLNVPTNTCTAAVYGELGRYPLFINRYVRILNYWLKIISTDNIILKRICSQAVADCDDGNRNWVHNIKNMLNAYGLTFLFYNAHFLDVNSCVCTFKNRVIDNFPEEWSRSLERSSVLDMYRQFKVTLEYETYLNEVPRSLRYYFCRLRMCQSFTNPDWETH